MLPQIPQTIPGVTNDRPSVALVHYSLPSVVGGVETVMAEHARLFLANGYRTMQVAGRGRVEDSRQPAYVIPEMDTEHEVNRALMSMLQRDALPHSFGPAREQIEYYLTGILAASDVVIAHNVLTTHLNLPLTAALHALADRRLIRHMIVWCHDVSRYVNPVSGAVQHIGYPWDLLRTYRPEFTYVAVSASRQQLLARVMGCEPERIHVIPNGVNLARTLALSEAGLTLAVENALLSAALIILMPVRITRAKNIEFGLQVVRALKARETAVKLVVSGPPDPHAADREDYFKTLKKMRDDLLLQQDVVFLCESKSGSGSTRNLSAALIAELYRLSDLILMPSYREGFGLPVLEAALAGKPVFATAMPAVTEISPEDGWLIQSGETPESVAERISLWTRRDNVHRLRRKIRQDYTWRAIFARQIEPLVETVRRAREVHAT